MIVRGSDSASLSLARIPMDFPIIKVSPSLRVYVSSKVIGQSLIGVTVMLTVPKFESHIPSLIL